MNKVMINYSTLEVDARSPASSTFVSISNSKFNWAITFLRNKLTHLYDLCGFVFDLPTRCSFCCSLATTNIHVQTTHHATDPYKFPVHVPLLRTICVQPFSWFFDVKSASGNSRVSLRHQHTLKHIQQPSTFVMFSAKYHMRSYFRSAHTLGSQKINHRRVPHHTNVVSGCENEFIRMRRECASTQSRRTRGYSHDKDKARLWKQWAIHTGRPEEEHMLVL